VRGECHHAVMRASVLIVVLIVAACGADVPAETSTPEATPEPTPVVHGPPATGEIIELGEGTAHGSEWRYAVYPSAEGWCLQVEVGPLAGSRCGITEPPEGETFAGVNVAEADADVPHQAIDGVVSAETATVWLVADGGLGRRVPALLVPLDEAGIDAQAFLGLPPPGMNVTHLQAVAFNGRILQTYELP
jgi:hypothetical protein